MKTVDLMKLGPYEQAVIVLLEQILHELKELKAEATI
jgi:hypothetical protein